MRLVIWGTYLRKYTEYKIIISYAHLQGVIIASFFPHNEDNAMKNFPLLLAGYGIGYPHEISFYLFQVILNFKMYFLSIQFLISNI